MMTPNGQGVSRLYQGRREAIRATACLICRTPAHVFETNRSRLQFVLTGICGECHDAIDAWCAQEDRAGPAVMH